MELFEGTFLGERATGRMSSSKEGTVGVNAKARSTEHGF